MVNAHEKNQRVSKLDVKKGLTSAFLLVEYRVHVGLYICPDVSTLNWQRTTNGL